MWVTQHVSLLTHSLEGAKSGVIEAVRHTAQFAHGRSRHTEIATLRIGSGSLCIARRNPETWSRLRVSSCAAHMNYSPRALSSTNLKFSSIVKNRGCR